MGANHKIVWTKPEPKKNLIQKLIPFSPLLVLLLLVPMFLPKNQADDHELMEELVQKNKWSSMEHLSAVLRLCQSGNEKACRILEEYPEHRNMNIPKISGVKTNKKLVDLYNSNFTKSEVSRLLYNVLKDKYPDLDSIFEAGLKKIKKVSGMTEGIIEEIKWLLLEKGYDPTEWLTR